MRDALLELLTAWREAPNVQLAHRIVALGATSKTAVTHKTWLDVARQRRAEDVSSLLTIAAVGKSAVLQERLAALSGFPDDPRIERFVAGLYEKPPVTSPSVRTLWTQVWTLAARIRDASALSSLRRLRDSLVADSEWNVYLRGQLDRVLLDAVERDEPLSPELDARLLEIDHTLNQRTSASWEDLQAVFLTSPFDETARAATMDALLAVGHARAKLMELQAAGADVAKFVKTNAESLLGPLAAVIKPSAVFDRGWLREAELRQGGNNSQRLAREATAGHPLWATVETLAGPGDAMISVHPVMKSLRTLKRSELRVSELPAQLERLIEYRLERDDVLRLANPETLPALRELHVHLHADDVELLLSRASALETFGVLLEVTPRVAGPLVDRLFHLEGPRVRVGFLGGMAVEFEREGSVVAAHVSATPSVVSECEWLLQRCRALGAVRVTLQFDGVVDGVSRARLAEFADELR